MKTLTLPLKDSDIDTRGKRRRVCEFIAGELCRVAKAEEAYKERIPENLMGSDRYLDAEYASEELLEASISVSNAFDSF